MKPTSLLEIARSRKPAEELLAGLLSDDMSTSLRAGQKLVRDAKSASLDLPDYLNLAIDTSKGEFAGSDLSGFEATLAFLNLPVRDDFGRGVTLQAAAETFQTYPGTRAMFPPVIDALLQWKYRQDQFESADQIVSQTRGISGIELITTVVNDNADDYKGTGPIAELARIPVRSLRTGEKSVPFYKYGSGIRFSYEFERRASLDIVTPYASRIERETEMGKVGTIVNLLVNGDGVAAAAPVVTATSLVAGIPNPPTITAGALDWEVLLAWVISRAKAGVPIDTVIGNWDLYLTWQRMFAKPTANQGPSQIEILAKAGVQTAVANPRFDLNLKFAVASAAPAAKLVGIVKNETVEELTENGSDIEESTRAIENQSVTYVKTQNRGYRLIFDDTRSVLSLA